MTQPLFESKLVDRKQAAFYLGVAPQTLAIWACTRRHNLPYVRIGGRVKYRIQDLDAFIAANMVAGKEAA